MNEPKYFRCEFCNRILTDRMIAKGICLGHRVKVAGYATLWEWILCKLRIIR